MRRLRVSALPTVAATACLLALSSCASADPDAGLVTSSAERKVIAVAQAGSAPDVVRATDRFGLTMLTSAPLEANVVVSPASAVIALSMLAEGAKGETADQFDAALGAPGGERTDAVNALLAALEGYAGDPTVVQDEEPPKTPVVHLANQVVLDEQVELLPDYLDSLSSGYGAGVVKTDLTSNAGKEVLDAWVNKNTGGLIEESAIEPNEDLRLVLQNAIVLAARWAAPFKTEATHDLPFTTVSGEQVDAQMMAQEAEFAHVESRGWQAVRLPYSAGLHADVLLPPLGTDPASIGPDFKSELTQALDDADPILVNLAIPKLDVEPEALDLTPALEGTGLGELFQDPDLSGISDVELALGQAVQQATLTVDEAGTVAAAVTELGMVEMSAPLPTDSVEMRVDRPFLLSISHTDTSWPLFVAAIRDPNA